MKIKKVLSKNDTGETGGHQAGMCIPRIDELLSFFPTLDKSVKNPRAEMNIIDEHGIKWAFVFIYYNNKFFDENGTRNEYRLTGMTKYFRANSLKAEDTIFLLKENGNVSISFERAALLENQNKLHEEDAPFDIENKDKEISSDIQKELKKESDYIVLTGKWKICRY